VLDSDLDEALVRDAADDARPALTIDVFFDFVCPWCLIGKRHLRAALDTIAGLRPDVRVAVRWRSVPLLPDTPPEGLPYEAFYLARLGSAEAVAARRAQVRQAGAAAGVEFAFERIAVMPGTLAAHSLVAYAGETLGEAQQAALVERLFTAYFVEGENIGDAAVLERQALASGLPREGLREHLGDAQRSRHSFMDQALNAYHGIGSVPHYVLNGAHGISGAHSPDFLVKAMLESIRA